MPTAARMVAGVLYAALVWYVSQLIKPLFPEGTDLGLFAEVNAAIGFLCGWILAGSRAGGSWSAAVSYGLTTVVAITFWGLLIHSTVEMVTKSMRMLYRGPADAVTDVFGMIVEFGILMAKPDILGMLVVGGVLAAILTEITGRNFR
jgi:hypothetical protein